jgi:hypothetical protein
MQKQMALACSTLQILRTQPPLCARTPNVHALLRTHCKAELGLL